MERRRLTDLEAAALGVVSVYGPCTAYKVRQFFLGSPSARFSGSAGAIYPLLRRLEREGEVKSTPFAQGKRSARSYSITRAGKRVLQEWIRGPFDPPAFFVDDPLRTRALFLDQLPAAQRAAWIDDAEHCVQEQEAIVRQRRSEFPDDPWVALADENARALNRARLAWLRKMRGRLPKD